MPNFIGKHIQLQLQQSKKILLSHQLNHQMEEVFNSLNDVMSQYVENVSKGFRDCIFNLRVVVQLFVHQVLQADKSCKSTLINFILSQQAEGKKVPALNTGPYCKARKRIPEELVLQLAKWVGEKVAQQNTFRYTYAGRSIKCVDGTTVKMPDTPENEAAYPSNVTEEGIGFPLARIVVLMSLTVCTVLDYCIGTYAGEGSGELSLFSKLIDKLNCNDILLADRCYTSFFLIYKLSQQNVEGMFRGPKSRKYDFQAGKKLGKDDHIVAWKKPSLKPIWLSEEDYAACPDELRMREFKSNGRIFVTTFLNAKKHPKKALVALYDFRWQIELHLRSIKATLKMDFLSCKTPSMVRKEIDAHFLGYNLIRLIIAQSCYVHQKAPWEISFKSALQIIIARWGQLGHMLLQVGENILSMISLNRVGNRSGRIEPRSVKTRKKAFPYLVRPRHIEREKIIKNRKKKFGEEYAFA
jgi:hypothetical protein